MFFIIFDIYELLILLIFFIKIYNEGWFYDMKNNKMGVIIGSYWMDYLLMVLLYL